MEQWITIIMLVVALAIQEIRHSRERKDLCNRIMSRDIQEYRLNIIGRNVPNVIRKNVSDEAKRKNTPIE